MPGFSGFVPKIISQPAAQRAPQSRIHARNILKIDFFHLYASLLNFVYAHTINREVVKALVKDGREDEVINLIKQKGEIVRNDIEDLLNVSPATATRLLTKMVDNGQIKRSGSARNIKYKL